MSPCLRLSLRFLGRHDPLVAVFQHAEECIIAVLVRGEEIRVFPFQVLGHLVDPGNVGGVLDPLAADVVDLIAVLLQGRSGRPQGFVVALHVGPIVGLDLLSGRLQVPRVEGRRQTQLVTTDRTAAGSGTACLTPLLPGSFLALSSRAWWRILL